MLKKEFAEHLKEGIQAEPVLEEEICVPEDDDNFAIGIRIDYHIAENVKVIISG